MKKVLTVLLAIAVVFTFSFGSTVAFAADDTYSYDEWNTALRAEKDAQLGYLAGYKTQALAKYNFNDEGYVSASFADLDDEKIEGFTKAALAAAADAVIDDVATAMDKLISAFLNDESHYKEVKPTATAVTGVIATAVAPVNSAQLMKDAIEGKTTYSSYVDDLNKAQAPETEKTVTAKIDAVKVADYNSKDKNYKYTAPTDSAVIGSVAKGSDLTAADAVTAIIDDAKDAIKDGKKEDTDEAKRLAYEKAYRDFKAVLDSIDTQADEDFNDITNDTNLAAAVDKYAAFGYDLASALIEGKYKDENGKLLNKASWETEVTGALKAFWDENSKNSKDGKLFGIAVSDYTKITRAEATTIYNAMKDEITKSKAVVTGWANHNDKKAADVKALYNDEAAKFYNILDRAMDAVDKYADVVKEGNKLKAEYRSGVKQYNDAKVDEAVKKAEEFVYGDLNKTTDYAAPKTYIAAAADDINNNHDGLDNLKEDGAKWGFDNFKDAVNDAAKKIYEDGIYYDQGNNNKAVTKKVSAGSDKTADEDLVYLKETYATSEADDWDDIAEDTIDALRDAQSKAEIESIMKKAAEDFGALLKKDDQSDVEKARDAYKDALEGFIKQTYGLLDTKGDYSDAYGANGTRLPSDIKADCPLYAKGADLIDDANTVDAVKAAYADAQALVTGAKTNSELKDMKKAVEKKITALPGTSKLAASDLDAVKEAYAALAEYADLAGAKTLAPQDLKDLYEKYKTVIGKFKDQVEDEAEDLFDKMDDVDTYSDADLAKYTAYKAEAQALVDKVDALNDEIEDINDDKYLSTSGDEKHPNNVLDKIAFDNKADYSKIKDALEKDIVTGTGNFYRYEIENAKRLLIEANKPNATAAQMKAALDAFNALTERQQLDLDQNNDYYYQIAKAIADKQGTSVKELKITAKSTAKKGSITVTWTVKGSADIDGYEVWKSTKHSKGYKKAFTTKKQTYKNTKGLKKGTRYYYKVRAYKMVEGKKITSDWSNKARRVAK